MATGLCYTYFPNFCPISRFWRCKEHICPLSPHLELWRMLENPDLGFASWHWFGYGHWSLTYPWSRFLLSILIFKVQRTLMSLKSWYWAFGVTGGSWLGFGILILIWIWSLVFGRPIFQILGLYLDFEGWKNIHDLWVLIWGLEDTGGSWMEVGIWILI